MKPEQQRTTIAEACGWKHYHEDLWVSPNVTDFSELDCEQLPDYLNDLNAMNSAVLQKFNGPSHEGWAFIDNLRVACGIPHSSTCMALVCATAAQRAEAFLKTLNLWTND
jgi:hypothetical protein